MSIDIIESAIWPINMQKSLVKGAAESTRPHLVDSLIDSRHIIDVFVGLLSTNSADPESTLRPESVAFSDADVHKLKPVAEAMSDAKPCRENHQSRETRCSTPDVSKTSEMIGFGRDVSFTDKVIRTVEWFQG